MLNGLFRGAGGFVSGLRKKTITEIREGIEKQKIRELEEIEKSFQTRIEAKRLALKSQGLDEKTVDSYMAGYKLRKSISQPFERIGAKFGAGVTTAGAFTGYFTKKGVKYGGYLALGVGGLAVSPLALAGVATYGGFKLARYAKRSVSQGIANLAEKDIRWRKTFDYMKLGVDYAKDVPKEYARFIGQGVVETGRVMGRDAMQVGQFLWNNRNSKMWLVGSAVLAPTAFNYGEQAGMYSYKKQQIDTNTSESATAGGTFLNIRQHNGRYVADKGYVDNHGATGDLVFALHNLR